VHLDTRFATLGYDSLMYTELGVALEAAGATLPEDITGIQNVRDLAGLVGARSAEPARPGKKAKAKPAASGEARDLSDIELPELVQRLGHALFGYGQRIAYSKIMRTRVEGQANVPPSGRFLVAANHASHLDMGLVKHALGDQGRNLVALAARDYFFESWRGAYFKNFTNLLPMERQGSLKESLRLASEVVQQGYILLIFPEGTRSTSGQMTDFKASLGYLALTNKVDVLPMYLAGTYGAWPKGQALPSIADIGARIGPVITYEELRRRTEKMSRSEAYRAASGVVEEAVKRLRDRTRVREKPTTTTTTFGPTPTPKPTPTKKVAKR
jgi:long-chain acyl-CoA synthetase